MLEAEADDVKVWLERTDPRAVVVYAAGDLDYDTAPELDAALRQAAEAGGAVVADLSAVDFADSTILHILTRARVRAENDTQTLLLAGPLSDTVTRLFQVTGLESAFRFAPDAQTALSGLPGKRQ